MQCKCMQKCGKWISQKKWRNWFLYFSTYYFIFLLCRIAWTKKPWSYALCTDLKSTLLKRYLHFEKSIQTNCKPDYSVTFFGFFHMCDLGGSFTFHFHKKNYWIIRNIFTDCCFDPSLKREEGGWCNLFWDKDSKEK